MRESVAKFCRSRAMKIVVPVVLVLGCMAGWLSYCYVGLLDVQEEDLLGAEVYVLGRSDHAPVDLADPAMRVEIARLLNSLHRWWYGEATECAMLASLEVKLPDGVTYWVGLWRDDSMELLIDRGGPDQQTSIVVNSGDMKRFLTE